MSGFHVYARPGTAVLWCNFTVGGQAQRVSTGERDPAAAHEAAARLYLEACQRARVPVPAGAIDASVAILCTRYLADLAGRIERRELVRNPRYHDDATAALARVAQRWGRLAEVGPGWEAALADWHAEGATWRYLQVVTVFTRAFLRWAVRLGLLPIEPRLHAPADEDVNAEAKERRPLSARERDAFLRALRGTSAGRVYTIMFYTAARKSDLERLRLRQVNWRTGFVTLPPRQTKSRQRGQELYLHPKALAALRAEVRERQVVEPDALVFGPIDLRAAFKHALDAAGIRDRDGLVPHHVTRHTAATLAGDAGASLAELMAFGRWATPGMAARYMRVSAQRAKSAAERL